MRDIVNHYRRLVGEFLTSDVLDFGIEDAARKVSSAAYRLGRRIKGPTPKTDEQVQLEEAWENLGFIRYPDFVEAFERDVMERQQAALAEHIEHMLGRLEDPRSQVSIPMTFMAGWKSEEDRLVKRAEEIRDTLAPGVEAMMRAVGSDDIEWGGTMLPTAASRAESLQKLRDALPPVEISPEGVETVTFPLEGDRTRRDYDWRR
jgi:hypothetical protein